jgi:hypothetical protein
MNAPAAEDRRQDIAESVVIQALNVINYAPHVRHAAERNDTSRLERYRLRFRGALDLYPV